jgi:hypothetical protein
MNVRMVASVVSKMLWAGVALATIGGAALFGSAFFATGAPQQAAAGALAACCGVLPYVFARSWDELTK